MNTKRGKSQKGKIIVVCVALVLVTGIATFFLTGNLRNYSYAQRLQSAGRYDEALAIYETIHDYKDSMLFINECKYQQAIVLENDGKYADAQAAFEAIADYSESATHISECKYQQAIALENDGKYADAQAAFEAIADYSESATHINECKYQQAVALKKDGDLRQAQTMLSELGNYKDCAKMLDEVNAILDQFSGEIARIDSEKNALIATVADATALLETESKVLDESTITALQALITTANAQITDLTSYDPVTADDYIRAVTEMSEISYSVINQEIGTAKTALEDSITQYNFVNNPAEDFVIDRLRRVTSVAYIAAATEDNDPNNNLGKQGGYTAQIYFSSPLVDSTYASNSKLNVIELGTSCGGSIEVYETVEDAERRNAYLSTYDGTAFSTGRHTVIGTVIVRTSSRLKASDQKRLEAEIIEALTAINPGPIIEKKEIGEEKSNINEANTSNQNESTLTVKESAFGVYYDTLYCAVIIHNNLSDKAVRYPELRITSRDDNGNLIGVNTSMVTNVIYPGQDSVCIVMAGTAEQIPSTVEIECIESASSWSIVDIDKLENPQYIPLEIKNATLKKGKYSTSVIGEVYNPNNYDISTAGITVVSRDQDGKLLVGDSGYVSNIEAGATVPFEVSIVFGTITDNFEVYAQPW